MVGRMYMAVPSTVWLQGELTLFCLLAPADACVYLHEIFVGEAINWLGQAEATNCIGSLDLYRGATTNGSGTDMTVTPMRPGDPAFGGSMVVGSTSSKGSDPSGGTIFMSRMFNFHNSFRWVFHPGRRPLVPPSTRLHCMISASVPLAARLFTVLFEELGG